MNKYQDALDFIIAATNGGNGMVKELNTLQELVDKATPKKVEKNIEDVSYCPNCKVVVANKNIINDLNYCHYCGQAVDWSDE